MLQGKQVANTGIVWSQTPGRGTCLTWTDVVQRLHITPDPEPVTVDPFTTPYGAPYVIDQGVVDWHGSWLQLDTIATAQAEVHIADGAQIKNIGGGAQGSVRNSLILVSEGTGGVPSFAWDSAPGNPIGFLSLSAGGTLRNDGTAPTVTVPTGSFFIFGCILNGSILPPAHGQPVVALAPNAIMILAYFDTLSTDTSSNFDPSWITGDGTTLLGVEHNGGFDFTVISTWIGFTGTVINFPLGFNGDSGPTAFRPTSMSGNIPSGMFYFDTSIGPGGLPIWWSQFHGYWVDATGAGPQ